MKKFFLSRMFQKIFGVFVIGLSFFIAVNVVGAETSGTSIADGAQYMIDTSLLDPVRPGRSVGGEGGIVAFRSMIQSIGKVILVVIMPILAGVALVIAGYFLIFSYASDENVTRAKTIIKYNLIAILVAFFSGAIISVLASFL